MILGLDDCQHSYGTFVAASTSGYSYATSSMPTYSGSALNIQFAKGVSAPSDWIGSGTLPTGSNLHIDVKLGSTSIQ